MEQQMKTHRMDELMEIARLRFGMIAPVIQETYPDESVMAYCRRVSQTPMRLPDGRIVKCTVFSKAVQSPFPSFFSYASPFSSNQLSRVLFPLFILRVRIWNSRMVSRVKTIHKTVRNITAS